MELFLSTILLHIEIKALLDVIYTYNNIPNDFYFGKFIRK